MVKTVRSRSDKTIGDTIEEKWTIVAKRVIAPPTPRTPFAPPRLGIYDYDVVPLGKGGPVASASDDNDKPPMIAFRRMK
jgi:hypothetical protein